MSQPANGVQWGMTRYPASASSWNCSRLGHVAPHLRVCTLHSLTALALLFITRSLVRWPGDDHGQLSAFFKAGTFAGMASRTHLVTSTRMASPSQSSAKDFTYWACPDVSRPYANIPAGPRPECDASGGEGTSDGFVVHIAPTISTSLVSNCWMTAATRLCHRA